MSDDSDDSCCEREITEGDYQDMLKMHVRCKKINKSFSLCPNLYQEKYGFYGSSLILEHDKYHDRQKKRNKTEKLIIKKKPHIENNSSNKTSVNNLAAAEHRRKLIEAKLQKQQIQKEKDMNYKRRKLWNIIVKKEVPKVSWQTLFIYLFLYCVLYFLVFFFVNPKSRSCFSKCLHYLSRAIILSFQIQCSLHFSEINFVSNNVWIYKYFAVRWK